LVEISLVPVLLAVGSIVVQTDVVVSVQWKQLIALEKLDNEG
jgi:hypothetical protein